MANGADTLKKVFLELGGKSANIILDDADFEVGRARRGDGVHARRPGLRDHHAHAPAPVALRRGRRDGEGRVRGRHRTATPTTPATSWGRSSTRTQRERVLGYIEKGKAEGARLVVGGGRPEHLPKGYFVRADAVRRRRSRLDDRAGGDLRAGARASSRTRTTTTRCASPTTRAYGLSGAVTSGSLERAVAIARRIRTGTVSVNGGQWFGPDSPFGGYTQSGNGPRARRRGLRGVPRDQDARAARPRVSTEEPMAMTDQSREVVDAVSWLPADVRLGRGGAAAPQAAAGRRVPAVRPVRLRRGRRRAHHRPRPRADSTTSGSTRSG